MIYFNEKISPRQMFFMVLLGFSGVTCMYATDLNVRYAGRYAVISIAITILFAYLITALFLRMTKKLNFSSWNSGIKTCVFIVLGIKYSVLLVLLALSMVSLVKKEIIPDVSYFYICALIFIVILYVSGINTEARARLLEVMFYPALIVLVLFFVFGMTKIHIYRLELGELLKSGEGENLIGIVKAVVVNMLLFVHPEMAVLLIKRTEQHRRKSAGKAILSAILITGILNILTYIETAGTLSVNMVRAKNDSVIRLIKIFKMPYISFERQGGLFIIFFILSMFFAVICVTSYLGYSLGQCGFQNQKVKAGIFAVILAGGTIFLLNNSDYFAKIKEIHQRKIPIEKRLYAGFLLIDREQGEYQILLSFKTEYNGSKYRIMKVKDLENLQKQWETTSEKHLDLSGVKAIMLTDELVKDSRVKKQVLDFMENNDELSDNLLLCVTDSSFKQTDGEQPDNETVFDRDLGEYIESVASQNIGKTESKFYRVSLVLYETDKSCNLARFHIGDKNVQYAGTTELSVN